MYKEKPGQASTLLAGNRADVYTDTGRTSALPTSDCTTLPSGTSTQRWNAAPAPRLAAQAVSMPSACHSGSSGAQLTKAVLTSRLTGKWIRNTAYEMRPSVLTAAETLRSNNLMFQVGGLTDEGKSIYFNYTDCDFNRS